ncbi:MAG: hypothetical protein LBG92_08255 [Prevotellaceae bacterium]|jgi:hypothetical protein|nr:hypothetical protein [Prevotellaceae bacterium]
MKRNFIKPLVFAAIAGASMMMSCNRDSNDDNSKTELKSVEVSNAELKTALQQKGFAFDGDGKLIVDDRVANADTLNLSGCNLSDASGLEVFPKLTEVNLSNNKFPFVFDFSVLPATVNSVNLAGNEIYEYLGLVKVDVEENGDETVTLLRDVKKLYLPESARHNCDEIVYFYAAAKNVDLKMANAAGQLAQYTTLREVPDENLRAYLKTNFPSMFDKDNPDLINIANRMINATEASKSLLANSQQVKAGIENVEGSQYIAMNPSFKGVHVYFWSKTGCELKYFRVKSGLYNLQFQNVNTAYINWTEAKNLFRVVVTGNNTIERIDFSVSEKFGQRGADIDCKGLEIAYLDVYHCPKLKTIALPRAAKYISAFRLYNLPLLEEVDLSQFSGIGSLALGGLPGLKKLTYFTPDGWYSNVAVRDPVTGTFTTVPVLQFTVSNDIYAHTETKAFLDTYHEHCNKYTLNTYLISYGLKIVSPYEEYDWTKDYGK